jgi:hypothetical protein
MADFLVELFRKLGIWILPGILAFGVLIWLIAHQTAEPGGKVSVLWGMVEYTKGVPLESSQLGMNQQTPLDANPKEENHGNEPSVFFYDDFGGGGLQSQWDVIYPNNERFLVKNSQLVIINATKGWASENLFRLNHSLPNGNWVMTALVDIEPQTAFEQFYFGVSDAPDKGDYLGIKVWWSVSLFENGALLASGTVQLPHMNLALVRTSDGEPTIMQRKIWKSKELIGRFSEMAKEMPQPIRLRLEKSEFTYRASVKLKGREWLEVEKLTNPRPKKHLVLGASNEHGESLVSIDWVKIEAVSARGSELHE